MLDTLKIYLFRLKCSTGLPLWELMSFLWSLFVNLKGYCVPPGHRKESVCEKEQENWKSHEMLKPLRAHLARVKQESASHHLGSFILRGSVTKMSKMRPKTVQRFTKTSEIQKIRHLEKTRFPFGILHWIVTLTIKVIPVKLVLHSKSYWIPPGSVFKIWERKLKITWNVETWDFALRAHLARGNEESASHHLGSFILRGSAGKMSKWGPEESRDSPKPQKSEILNTLKIDIFHLGLAIGLSLWELRSFLWSLFLTLKSYWEPPGHRKESVFKIEKEDWKSLEMLKPGILPFGRPWREGRRRVLCTT